MYQIYQVTLNNSSKPGPIYVWQRINKINQINQINQSINQSSNRCSDPHRDSIVVSIGDGVTSIFGGFVIFSFLGHMAHEMNVKVQDVVTNGKSRDMNTIAELVKLTTYAWNITKSLYHSIVCCHKYAMSLWYNHFVVWCHKFAIGIIKQLPIHDVWYIIMHFKQLQECLMSQMCDDIIKQ